LSQDVSSFFRDLLFAAEPAQQVKVMRSVAVNPNELVRAGYQMIVYCETRVFRKP
jgi:hypothetical protein